MEDHKIREIVTSPNPETTTLISYPKPDRFSYPAISPPSHQGLTGFLRSLYQTIYSTLTTSTSTTTTTTTSRFKTFLPLPDSGPRTEHLYPLLEKIYQHTLFNLHDVMDNLQYWNSISSSSYPYPEIALTILGTSLAIFLSELYVELDLFEWRVSSVASVASLLGAINGFLLKLHYSVSPIRNICGIYPLKFEELPGRDNEESVQNDCDDDIRDANLILSNLNKLDSFLSRVIDRYRKPSKQNYHRIMCYTFGAVGISLVSVLLLRHTSSVVLRAKESITRFFSYHVEQPLTRIRDGLLERFLHRRELEMTLKELQLGSEYLHSFERQASQAIQNLTGEVDYARSMLIKLHQLNVDIDAGLSEMKNQLLRGDEMQSVIFAAFPKFFFSFGALVISPRVRKYIVARRRKISRFAYAKRRLLIDEVEGRIMQIQNCNEWPPQTQEGHYVNGLLLYTLDRLSRDAERDAKKTLEWDSLQEDLFALGNTEVGTSFKGEIISRLRRMYHCLNPPRTIRSLNDLTVGGIGRESCQHRMMYDCMHIPTLTISSWRVSEQTREMERK